MHVIPRPKHCEYTGSKPLVFKCARPMLKIICENPTNELSGTIDIITEQLQNSFNIEIVSADTSSELAVKIVLTNDTSAWQSECAQILTPEDQDFIRTLKSNEGYLLKTCCGTGDDAGLTLLAAPAQQGLLYGAMSLRQLMAQDADSLSCARVTIYDWPDIEYRAGARWLLCGEGCRWSYDWGDGREKLIERFKTKIDRCMQNKINMAFFDGFAMNYAKYPGYAQDVCMLNNYALARGVKLVFGCYGIGIGGCGGEDMLAEVHNFIPGASKSKNRKSYPDGELYPCCGNNPNDPGTRYNGTCRGNEKLNELKKLDMAEYVRIIQPGALYIHHEDHSRYSEGNDIFWAQRCDECREKWPDDRLEKTNGGAGAIAHGYNQLCEAIFSVKDEQTGYYASRDCVVILISPAYGDFGGSDSDWDKIVELWTNISREMAYTNNVQFGFREQFWRHDNAHMRIKEMAENLKTRGKEHGIFLFAVSGADLYLNDALFSAGPVLNSFFEGSSSIFNFSGVIFQDLQELFNSEFTWNLHSDIFSEIPASYTDAVEKFVLYTQKHHIPAELAAEGGFIEECCQHLYGDEAGKLMARLFLLGTDTNEFPLAVMYYQFSLKKLFLKSKDLKEYDSEAEQHKWHNIVEQTEKALELIDNALKCDDLKTGIRPDVEQLRKCLIVGKMFAGIVCGVFTANTSQDESKDNLIASITVLEKFISGYFEFNFSSPGNSDIELWPEYIERLKKVVETNFPG